MIDSSNLTVIIPVRDGGEAFKRCLQALRASNAAGHELLVVDDESSDGSGAAALAYSARVISAQDSSHKSQVASRKAQHPTPQSAPLGGGHARAQAVSNPAERGASSHQLPITNSRPAGPAAARNLGARAAGREVLLFLDSDVAVHPDTLGRVASAFAADPGLVAAFGSYDDQPADPGFISQFKNLFHHYVHQHARAEASTFWAGCGAIRRTAFLALGGFDQANYPRPSIEDIDLGYRLSRSGAKIVLRKDWQVTHLKRWTFGGLLRTDVFDRGVPWTRLLWRETLRAQSPGSPRPYLMDLNLQTANRVSVACVYLLGLALAGAFFHPASWLGVALLAAALLWLNRDLYAFLGRRRGRAFMLKAILFHWLYYIYNGIGFALGTLAYLRDGAPRVAPDGSWVREEG